MFDRIKMTIKHTAVYSLGNIAIRLIGLILLPLYTSRLTLADYGILGILEVTVMLLVQGLIFGQAQSFLRFYGVEDYHQERKQILFTLMVFLTGIGGILVVTAQMASRPLALLFFEDAHLDIYFKLVFYQIALQIINTLFLSVLRAQEKSVFYSTVLGLKLLMVLSLNIILLIRYDMGVQGILAANLVGEGVLMICLLPSMIRNMQGHFLSGRLKESLIFGAPLIFSALSHMLLNVGDRYLLKLFVDYNQLGLYNLGYKVGGTLNLLLVQSFQLGLLPIAYKVYGQANDKRFYSKLLTYFLYVLVWAGLALAVLSKEVITAFARDPSYWPAYPLVPLKVRVELA